MPCGEHFSHRYCRQESSIDAKMTDSRSRKLPGKYKMSVELLIALESKKVFKKKKDEGHRSQLKLFPIANAEII